MALIKCKECGKQISSSAESCPNCWYTELKCPKCGSNKVKVISGASKAMSVALWGAFVANKVMSKYQCKTCGHKF